jgi:hypothetical protein
MTLKKPYSILKIKPILGTKKKDEYLEKLRKKRLNKRKK